MTTTHDWARATTLDTPAVRSLIETNPDVLLVDVRTPGEYESAHIAGSINLPLDKVFSVAAGSTTDFSTASH